MNDCIRLVSIILTFINVIIIMFYLFLIFICYEVFMRYLYYNPYQSHETANIITTIIIIIIFSRACYYCFTIFFQLWHLSPHNNQHCRSSHSLCSRRRLAVAPAGSAAARVAAALEAPLGSAGSSREASRAIAAAHCVPRFVYCRESCKFSELILPSVQGIAPVVAGLAALFK
jgi:magnesium-transporting ATPase (P-type)